MNAFSDFVKSLKRLYIQGKISHEKLDNMLENRKITKEEYNFIIGC